MARTSPTVRRRRLGQELRALREANQMTVEQVANELEWSPSKVSRIETTPIKVTTVDLKALLDVYGIHEKARRDGLLALGRESRERAWWMDIKENTPIRSFKDFIGFEAEARSIRTYEASFIPGLLQTESYARAILRAMLTEDADLEKSVKLRLERQEVVKRSDDPVNLTAIIDEAALRRPAGGSARDALMSEQLDVLLELFERSNIRILVVPFKTGLHPGMSGGFTVLELPHPGDPNAVYVEAFTHAVLFDDPDNVKYYSRVFDGVQQEALGHQASREFLADIRDEYKQG